MNRLARFGYEPEFRSLRSDGRSPTEVLLESLARLAPTGLAHRPVRAQRVWSSLRVAGQGLADTWRSQPNLRLHAYATIGVIAVGCYCRLIAREWLWLALAVGLVVMAELLNTAVEHTVDLIVGLRADPLARRAKDVAAAAVLCAAVLAFIIGCLVLGPHLRP